MVLRQKPLGPPAIWRITKYQLLSIDWPVYFVSPSLALVTDTVPKVFPHAASPLPPFLLQRDPGLGFREREKTI